MIVRGIFFPVGTKVRLASGSVDMIVVDVIPEMGEAICAWEYGGTIREEVLPTICLDVVRRYIVVDG